MKLMNMKRFGATLLAGALALSLSVPAFADDPPNTTTTITGSYAAITLAVTVPSTGTASINPYGLPVELKSGTDDDEQVDATISGQQIVSAPLLISNQSSVALSVSADVVGVATGDAVLIEDASAVDTEADGAIAKNIAAIFEAFAAPGFEGAVADLEEADINEAFAALDSANAALTAPVLEETEDVESTTTEGTLVLREADDEGIAQDGGMAFIRLSGNVAKNPTEAWATEDGFTATIAFTFEVSEYVGTVELTAAESVAAGSTAKVTVSGLPDSVKVKYDTIVWTSSKTTAVTVANGTKAPAAADNGLVALSALTGTVTGVKSGSTKSVITVEFEGNDGITYRGSVQIKCG